MSSEEFKNYVEENGVVTLVADYTDRSDEIKQMLKDLRRKGGALPFYAIFPADNPNSPITFDGLLSTAGVIEKLKQAGPSKSHAGATTADANEQGDRRTSKKESPGDRVGTTY